MAPAREFLTGPLAGFLTPGIAFAPGSIQCPVIEIDLPTLMGHQELSDPASSAFLCDWWEEQRTKFISILHLLIYPFGALMIYFRFS